jgi:FkbM family methyltransferase
MVRVKRSAWPAPAEGEDDDPAALIHPRDLFRSDDRVGWENACRRRALHVRLTGDDVLCRTLGRYTMVVDAADAGLAPHLIANGFWEIWIARLMAQRIRPGMVCLDAGANVGYFTVLMADLAGVEGRVIAAEPVPATFRLLERNLEHNGFAPRTEALRAALGAAAGEARLVMPAGEPKNAQVTEADPGGLDSDEYRWVEAPVIAVDDLDLPRLDFAKIDVEGAEAAVWAGMQRTLDRSPNIQIVMEINCRRYPDAAGFLDQLQARFPLRTIDGLGRPQPIAREVALNTPHDVMLYLSRRENGRPLGRGRWWRPWAKMLRLGRP